MTRAVTLNNLATALEDIGDPQAETYYRRSLDMRQAALPVGDLSIARAQHNLGRWLLREGRLGEARALLTQALAARSARLAPKHQERIDSEIALAEVQLRSGEVAQADARMQTLLPLEPEMRDTRRITLSRLQGLLATAGGDTALALQRHQAAADLAARILPSGHGAQLRLRLDLAAAQWAAGDKARATATLDAALPRALALPATAALRLRAEKLQAEMAAAR